MLNVFLIVLHWALRLWPSNTIKYLLILRKCNRSRRWWALWMRVSNGYTCTVMCNIAQCHFKGPSSNGNVVWRDCCWLIKNGQMTEASWTHNAHKSSKVLLCVEFKYFFLFAFLPLPSSSVVPHSSNNWKEPLFTEQVTANLMPRLSVHDAEYWLAAVHNHFFCLTWFAAIYFLPFLCCRLLLQL